MAGAYAGLIVYTRSGSFFAGLLAAAIISFLLGAVIERVLIRFYYHRPKEDQILVTFGLAIVLVEMVRAIFTGKIQLVTTPAWGQGAVPVFGFIYPEYRLQVIAIAAVVLVAVYLVLFKTNIGLVVRAGIDDSLIVSILGINLDRTFLLVFALGAMFAGFSGMIDAPLLAVNPDVGTDVLVQSFVVIVIGGVGSFAGAILGGLIAGEIVSLSTAFASDWSQVFLYVAMALVLILRPQGLLGVEGRA